MKQPTDSPPPHLRPVRPPEPAGGYDPSDPLTAVPPPPVLRRHVGRLAARLRDARRLLRVAEAMHRDDRPTGGAA
jgi:hypothetical protein